MCNMGAIGAYYGTAISSAFGASAAGVVGAVGLAKKAHNYFSGAKKSDSVNNKIQTVIATILAISTSLTFGTIFSPAFIPIGFAIGLAVNAPHIAKIFVKDQDTKEKLDNIAGIAAAAFNSLGLIPLVGLSLIIL